MLTGGNVRYSSLATSDDDDYGDHMRPSTSSDFHFGSAPGTFDSAFTYARYGDLDRLGYEVPRRFGNPLASSNYTYSPQFDREETEEKHVLSPVEYVIVAISFIFIVLTLPLSLLFTLKFVSNNERLVVLRLGRALKPRGPGTALVLPCIDSAHRVDTRVTAFNVPPLSIITADRGLVEMGATVYLQVRDALAAVCQVQDRNSSMRTLASSMLYRYVSKKRICELTGGHDKRTIAGLFKDELGQFTSQFGVEITQVELSEMKIVKEAENMGLASLSAVSKSEVGQQIWSVIGPTLEEISKEAREKQAATATASEPGPSTIGDLLDLHSPVQADEEGIDVDRLVTIVNMGIDQSLVMAIGKVFQFECEGMEQVVVDLRKGSCYKGVAHSADVVLRVDRKSLLPLLKQELSPMQAYMAGQLKISGRIQDAFSLRLLTDRIVHLL